ncbi:MAG TPA: STAS domain-containing protein [Solirubrobacteraceae bacterium]|jgi:anti-sigma B factor antagonist|nr:STAS domain-containing protein [Solirubrobacteraceae bacterium]
MLDTGGAAAGADPTTDSVAVSEAAGGVTVLALSGELDIARTPRLRVVINEILRTRPSGLVIDLCAVTFVDSTALALLLNAQRRATGQGIALQLACDVATTLELLSLTRLDREFEIHPSRPEAIRAASSTA